VAEGKIDPQLLLLPSPPEAPPKTAGELVTLGSVFGVVLEVTPEDLLLLPTIKPQLVMNSQAARDVPSLWPAHRLMV
jgi:hypothetical protein